MAIKNRTTNSCKWGIFNDHLCILQHKTLDKRARQGFYVVPHKAVVSDGDYDRMNFIDPE